jgi:hypothetical protein
MTSLSHCLSLLVLTALACSSPGRAVRDDAGGAAGGGESGDEVGGAGQDARGGAAGQDIWAGLPEPKPSQQTVRFEIENGRGEATTVLTTGKLCSPFEIWRVEGGVRTRVLRDFQDVGVYCSGSDYPTFASYTRLRAGDTLTLEWDAREDQVFERPVACPPVRPLIKAVPGPAKAGQYEAVFAWNINEGDCTSGDEEVTCFMGHGVRSHGELCDSRHEQLIVPFSLPDHGDITVSVVLPADSPRHN